MDNNKATNVNSCEFLTEQISDEIDTLVAKYKELRRELEEVKKQKVELVLELDRTKTEFDKLSEEYSAFKLKAGMNAISSDSEVVSQTKKHIANIVRQIDKCIEVLNR